MNGVSKSYAMTGWRIGYAAGPKELIDAMAKTSNYITVCPPHLAQLAGINALSMDKDFIDGNINTGFIDSFHYKGGINI